MFRILGVRSSCITIHIVIESSIANQIIKEKRKEELIFNYHCYSYQERSVVSSF